MGVLGTNFDKTTSSAAVLAAAQPRTVDPKTVQFYFSDLLDRDLHEFEQHWDDLRACRSFEAKEWTFVLYNVAKQLPVHPQATESRIRELRQFIHDNFDIWENGAKPHIRHADEQGIAISIWAMAILNEPASEDFMNKWTSRALAVSQTATDQGHSLRLWSLAVLDALNPHLNYSARYNALREKLVRTDFERQRSAKQVYDADLYFTGQSDLENPYRLETKSKSEGHLSRLFRQAGFKAYKPKDCIVPGLEKAIDFVVGKRSLILPTEVDGHWHFWGTKENQAVAQHLEYDSATLFRSVLMTKRAPDLKIARISTNLLSRLLDARRETQTGICRAIFNDFQEKLPAGCYAVEIPSETPYRCLARTQGGVLIPQAA